MILSVCTPTYNRAHLLPRAYESLISQDVTDFEWIIVDDGSSDETEQVVNSFICQNKIRIKYIKKTNGGKHTAHNLGAANARGDFFICLDSDDWFGLKALLNLIRDAKALDTGCCGIVYNKQNKKGELLGNIGLDCRNKKYSLYQLALDRGNGEYAIMMRTELVQKYPFPEIEGERFSGECILYDRLALEGYSFVLSPDVIEICEYQENGLTAQVHQIMKKNPAGYAIYHMQRIDLVNSELERIRHSIQYQAFRRMAGKKAVRYVGKHRWLVCAAWLPGILGAWYYSRKG